MDGWEKQHVCGEFTREILKHMGGKEQASP